MDLFCEGSEKKKTLGFGLSSLATCDRGPLDPRGRRCIYSHVRQYQFPWGSPGALRSSNSEATDTGTGTGAGTGNETRNLWSVSGVYAWRRQMELLSKSDMLEDGIVDVCTRYGTSCLSTRDALSVGLCAAPQPHPNWRTLSPPRVPTRVARGSHTCIGVREMGGMRRCPPLSTSGAF